MKYGYIGVAALAMAVIAGVLLRRKKASPAPEIDGGVRHFTDSGAPKVIASEDIVAFYCKFSTTDRLREDSPIAGHIITLEADDQKVRFELRGNPEMSGSAATDEVFFRQLQKIVSAYDFAQYNGRYYTVSGLPPDCGMELKIRYASGEEIRSSNNQSCFLPLEAMEALVALFKNHK